MSFASPAILYLLLPVAALGLIAFFVWSWRKHQVLMTEFIQTRLLSSLTVGISPARQKFKLACILLSVICLILALARPQWGFEWEEVKQKGLDIVVAIDVSKSMLAEDIAPNRLARAKLAALDLMQQAKSDRLGLVAFAGAAFLQCPLTIDDSAFRQSVDALDVNTIPEGGTALAEAIETAQAAFKEGDNYRVLVIFTDGEDHDSGAVEAAKKSGEAGMQIFTIGIGSPDGEILRIKDGKGRSDYIKDDQGNVVKSRLDEGLLRDIAQATPHGRYLRLQGPQAIDVLYRDGLAPLPKSESGEKLVRRYHERYHWPLALAMLFLALEMLVPERKSQRVRALQRVESGNGFSGPDKPARKRKSVLAHARTAVALLLLIPAIASASSSTALREYNAGKYDQALKEYEKLLVNNKKADPRLHFNAGAAAYQNKSFDEAFKQFNESLNSPDLQLVGKAYYNRGNTLYQLGATNPDIEERKKKWEDALKDFDSTTQLNHQDLDAKNNYEFVKQQLEELKKQQQQQNQQQQNKDDNQNQDQQQKQSQNQNQDKDKDQQQKDQQTKNQQQQKDQQDQKNQQAKDDKKDQQQKQDQASANEKQKDQKQKADQQQQQQQAKASKDKQGQTGENEGQGQPYALGQMTPQQAQQLLDSQKNEEMLLPVRPDGKPRQSRGPVKDW